MSRLQQGISKLNSLSNQGSSLSRLSSPSFGGHSTVGGGGGKNLEELKRQIHSKLVERLDLSRVKDLASDAMRRDIRRAIEHLERAMQADPGRNADLAARLQTLRGE